MTNTYGFGSVNTAIDHQTNIVQRPTRLRGVYDTQEIVAKIAESTKAAGG